MKDRGFSWLPHFLVLSVLIFLVIFLKLDTFHMRWWDESIFAVNTYEMLHNGKYFSLYFDGAPDLFNTKPPVTVWIQMAFVKLLGYNELALRMPSAVAAAATVLILFLFVRRRSGDVQAWIAALILLTSPGFIGFHTARTGDADSLLTFFVFISNIYFLKYTEESRGKYILLYFLALTAGFLVKMYAALLCVPAHILILILDKRIQLILNRWQIYAGLVFFAGCIAAFFCLRERDAPGYLEVVFFKEAGRLVTAVEGHGHTWEYYLDNLISSRYPYWFVPLLFAVLFYSVRKRDDSQRHFRNMLTILVSQLLILSLATTKLPWYDMPAYPMLAMITAYGLTWTFERLISMGGLSRKALVMFFIVFSYPYWLMFRKSQANTIPDGEKKLEAIERFLFAGSPGQGRLNGTKIYHTGWNGSLLFYKYKYAEKGETMELTTTPVFMPKDRVLLCNDSLLAEVKARYEFKILQKAEDAVLIEIGEGL